jgi:hypothetical protein
VNIKTKYDPKPIPNRAYDWEAWDEDRGEAGPTGFGEDEQSAINDLNEKLGLE